MLGLVSAVSAGPWGGALATVPGLVPAHGSPTSHLPPLSFPELLTQWDFDPIPLLFILVPGVLYVLGVVRLRRRGDRWSHGRTISFVVGGLGTCFIATQSFFDVYDLTLISVHMTQHMLLNMIAPIFFALGAPITLALRTMRGRGRALLLSVIHSRVAAVLTFPLVAMVIYVANPWVLYFTGIYEATLRNPWLHDLNHLHFVLVGCLWFWVLLGIDPLPRRPSYPMRLIAVLLTVPFHAFLGVTLMQSTTLIAGDYYLDLDRTWGPSPLVDQQIGGALLWGSGDIIAGVLFIILAVQWSRASDREARAIDRRLDLEEARAAAASRAAASAVGAAVAYENRGTGAVALDDPGPGEGATPDAISPQPEP